MHIYVCVYIHMCVQGVLRHVCPHWVSASIACHLTFDHNSIKPVPWRFLTCKWYNLVALTDFLCSSAHHLQSAFPVSPSSLLRKAFLPSQQCAVCPFSRACWPVCPPAPVICPPLPTDTWLQMFSACPAFVWALRGSELAQQALRPWRCPQPQHIFSVRWGLDSDLRDYPTCFLFSAVFSSVTRKLKAIVQLYYINALLVLPGNASPK